MGYASPITGRKGLPQDGFPSLLDIAEQAIGRQVLLSHELMVSGLDRQRMND